MRRCFLICSAAGVVFPGAAFGEFVYRGEWGSFGTGPGRFNCPFGVDCDIVGNGLVYVVDYENHRVQYFTATGSYLGQWGYFGNGDGQFRYPWGVEVKWGRVYVSDTRNHRIQYFTHAGSFLGKCGRYGSSDGRLDNPRGVAVTREGRV